jgi:hypothetical protein
MKQLKFFQINRRVRKFYLTTELSCCQRFSNNSEPKFTDIQVAAIYLYGLNLGLQKKKCVYNFAKKHLLKHCEHLPSYKQFCLRVNRLAPFFAAFCNAELKSKQKTSKTHLTDSAPVVVAKGSRSSRAKTAVELCDKGYCASRRFLITKASEHDLNAGRIMLKNAENMAVFADKAYIDEDWGYELQLRYVELITPFKERSKNQIPLDDGERAWNAMIASRRQQIETLVSQISEITCLQDAHVARSVNGLLAFIWARLALLAFSYW